MINPREVFWRYFRRLVKLHNAALDALRYEVISVEDFMEIRSELLYLRKYVLSPYYTASLGINHLCHWVIR